MALGGNLMKRELVASVVEKASIWGSFSYRFLIPFSR